MIDKINQSSSKLTDKQIIDINNYVLSDEIKSQFEDLSKKKSSENKESVLISQILTNKKINLSKEITRWIVSGLEISSNNTS